MIEAEAERVDVVLLALEVEKEEGVTSLSEARLRVSPQKIWRSTALLKP
jgi:hypothetical protein